MRLGDLDELKKYKFTTQHANGVEIEDIEVVPVAAIDNAQTAVIYSEEDMCNATSGGYDIGYDMARRLYERSQVKLANEVWKLYEKYQPYLATRVIEFGDELKEMLGKYQEGGTE